MASRPHTRCGFTLVELSIVLVVIGLLAGSIFLGRDLIRASETRKIHSRFSEFALAVNTFKLKHDCLPGDCLNATDFFGAHPDCPSLSGATPGDLARFFNDTPGISTCNGDGDSRIDANATFYEMTTFWQQLASAGLIPGSYTGGRPSAPSGPAWIGNVNVPTVLSESSRWLVFDGDKSVLLGMLGSTATIVPGHMGTVFNGIAGDAQSRIFTPADAFGYDAKYDDGSPVTGHILVAYGMSHCTDAVSESQQLAANLSAHYLANDPAHKDSFNCNLVYRAGF